jgi:hypothetical protein
LKRVVESIANGDSHVPFRDSKLTMLLQVISLLMLITTRLVCVACLDSALSGFPVPYFSGFF